MHHEQRIMERRVNAPGQEEERRVAEEQAQQHRIVVEHNFHLHSQLFRDKYVTAEMEGALAEKTSSATSSTNSSAPSTPRGARTPVTEGDAEPAQEPLEVKTSGEFLMFAK